MKKELSALLQPNSALPVTKVHEEARKFILQLVKSGVNSQMGILAVKNTFGIDISERQWLLLIRKYRKPLEKARLARQKKAKAAEKAAEKRENVLEILREQAQDRSYALHTAFQNLFEQAEEAMKAGGILPPKSIYPISQVSEAANSAARTYAALSKESREAAMDSLDHESIGLLDPPTAEENEKGALVLTIPPELLKENPDLDSDQDSNELLPEWEPVLPASEGEK